MITVTQADVEARLRRTLVNPDETEFLGGIIDEASALVEGYLGVEYSDSDDVPSAVIVVTSRVAARILVSADALPPLADSLTRGMGSFSATTHLAADATSGGPWLTKSDKVALQPFRVGGVASVPLTREGYIGDGS